jgi:UDP-glucose 4,6-dehydratase
MKWLIFGAKGWIGQEICGILGRCKDQEILQTDIHPTSYKEVRDEIDSLCPDRIVCCVGRTYGGSFKTIDYLEQKDKLFENLQSNLLIPVWIAQSTTKPILYFGTGCIFEYDETHTEENKVGFTEKDTPNFLGSSYSIVKGVTDQILGNYPNVINARIRMPISSNWHPRDFVTKIMSYKKITSISNSMTVLDEILPVLLGILYEGKIFGSINAVNPDTICHKEILDLFGRPSSDYELESQVEQNKHLLSQRSNNCLDSSILLNCFRNLEKETKDLFHLMPIENIKTSLEKIAKKREALRRVLLVTGGYGFIGSNFINKWMQHHPFDYIVNVDRLDPCASISNIVNTSSNQYISYIMDIQNTGKIREVLEKHKVTHMIHFAAETHVDNSFGNSISFTKSNILGTHSLLEAMLAYGKCKLFMHMSTDEVYGEVREGMADEESLLFPTNPYAATKAAAEYIVRSYGTSFQLPYMIVRANNIYGSRQYPEKVIPSFITKLLAGKKIQIQGDGSAKRMFLHIDDLLEGIEIVITKGQLYNIYNLGSKEEYTVKELADFLIKKIKKVDTSDDFIEYVKDRLFNDCRYSVDTKKVEQMGWKVRHNLFDSIDSVISWYKENPKELVQFEYWSVEKKVQEAL